MVVAGQGARGTVAPAWVALPVLMARPVPPVFGGAGRVLLGLILLAALILAASVGRRARWGKRLWPAPSPSLPAGARHAVRGLPHIRGAFGPRCLTRTLAVVVVLVAAAPAEVLAADHSASVPAGPPSGAGHRSDGGRAGDGGTFTCSIDGATSTIRTANSYRPDPVLGPVADQYLGSGTIATTPGNLPPTMTGITSAAPTSGSVSAPLQAGTFAAGFAGPTELYEVPDSSTQGPSPGGSPGAYDNAAGSPLSGLPVGTLSSPSGTYRAAGLPYAQVFPLVGGTPDFGQPLIPGGAPTSVYYQSYATNPTAWMAGGGQPTSSCGSREYAIVSFDVAAYLGHGLSPGRPYVAYLLLRDTGSTTPLANHLWYFELASGSTPMPTLSVAATNAAAGQGVYQQTETAPAPGEAVPFSIRITNTSALSETITAIRDSYTPRSTPVCPGDISAVVSPGGSVDCRFTLPHFAPPAGQSLADQVTVTVGRSGAAGGTAAAQASSTVVTAAPTGFLDPSVVVDTTNNAAGSGYGKVETVPAAGAPVPFQVDITNPSSGAERITAIWDRYGPTKLDVCSSSLGRELAPGASLRCSFTLAAYGPPSGQSLRGAVTVAVAQAGDPANTADGESSSTVTTAALLSLPPTVSVAMTNDAAGQGVYQLSETAPSAGAAVPLRLAITNTSSVGEAISSITDRYATTALQVCPALLGTPLAVNQTVSCGFTIADYSPAAGHSLTGTATVMVAQVGNPANTGSGQGSSTVATAAPRLTVTETVTAAAAVLGQTLQYTVAVTNTGTAPAQQVVVKDLIAGTAGFAINDGTGRTADSFAGRPMVPVTKTGVGDYRWTYPTLAANGGRAVATYTVTIRAPASASVIVNGEVALTNSVTVTAPAGCTSTSCAAQVTTSAQVPAGVVRAASTTPGTPATGAHLDLLPSGILVMAGLLLIGAAEVMRPKVGHRRGMRKPGGRSRRTPPSGLPPAAASVGRSEERPLHLGRFAQSATRARSPGRWPPANGQRAFGWAVVAAAGTVARAQATLVAWPVSRAAVRPARSARGAIAESPRGDPVAGAIGSPLVWRVMPWGG
ncbi:MAG: hypothetical protein ACYCYK_09565, partial [Candidatus Dormibacteria bacterium]